LKIFIKGCELLINLIQKYFRNFPLNILSRKISKNLFLYLLKAIQYRGDIIVFIAEQRVVENIETMTLEDSVWEREKLLKGQKSLDWKNFMHNVHLQMKWISLSGDLDFKRD
jgi:hypothetical protein